MPFIDKWRLVSLNGLVKTINRPPAWKTEGRSHTYQLELEVSYHDISTATDLVESLLSLQCDRKSDFHKPSTHLSWEGLMTYREQLHPWCIICHAAGADLPSAALSEQLVVARFRRRNNAEDHLKRMQRLSPGCSYSIIFDPTTRQTGPSPSASALGAGLPIQSTKAVQPEPGLT